jgi:deoxyribodipyrimidine photolyase-related protein
MRSYYDELKSKKFKVDYFSTENNFKVSYEKKLEKYIKNNKVKEIRLFEIEDKFFEKKILLLFKTLQLKINILEPHMFLTSRKDFKNYLDKNKRPFMANFYKINRV